MKHKKQKKNCRFIYPNGIFRQPIVYMVYTLSLVYIHSYQQIKEKNELLIFFIIEYNMDYLHKISIIIFSLC